MCVASEVQIQRTRKAVGRDFVYLSVLNACVLVFFCCCCVCVCVCV